MEFYPDEPEEPIFLGENPRDDDSTEAVEVYGLPLYDVPEHFEPTGVVVIIKGYWYDDDSPSLLFRTSSELAPYEIQALLSEGLKGTL